MEVFDSFSKPVQKFIEDCVIEMTNGMADTVDREVDGKMHGLKDEEDLVQYCYYVAGTVGKVLTKLFPMTETHLLKKYKKNYVRGKLISVLVFNLQILSKGFLMIMKGKLYFFQKRFYKNMISL